MFLKRIILGKSIELSTCLGHLDDVNKWKVEKDFQEEFRR